MQSINIAYLLVLEARKRPRADEKACDVFLNLYNCSQDARNSIFGLCLFIST